MVREIIHHRWMHRGKWLRCGVVLLCLGTLHSQFLLSAAELFGRRSSDRNRQDSSSLRDEVRPQRIFSRSALRATPESPRSISNSQNSTLQQRIRETTPVGNAAGISSGTASGSGAVDGDVRNHILQFDDLVRVTVYQEEDYPQEVRVDKDGRVNLPLLGSVPVGGLTVKQARDLIHRLLDADYLVNPQVNLTVIEYAKWSFTILGEVQTPGLYEVAGNKQITLLEAVGKAGGFKQSAKKQVLVTRTIGGEKKIYKVDVNALALDRNAESFPILPNDHITVRQTFF